jgi:hypothetical protein
MLLVVDMGVAYRLGGSQMSPCHAAMVVFGHKHRLIRRPQTRQRQCNHWHEDNAIDRVQNSRFGELQCSNGQCAPAIVDGS